MSLFDEDEIAYERTLPDGTLERGTMRLLGLPVTSDEADLLRDIAYAVERFQRISDYVAGYFLKHTTLW